jgi:hypothetical protein
VSGQKLHSSRGAAKAFSPPSALSGNRKSLKISFRAWHNPQLFDLRCQKIIDLAGAIPARQVPESSACAIAATISINPVYAQGSQGITPYAHHTASRR